MQHRVHFINDQRPKRIAKAIFNQFKKTGFDIPMSQVREAVAFAYGYENWNDLLDQIGLHATSPYDHEISWELAEARISFFSSCLSERLGLPLDVCEWVTISVGPTSRKTLETEAHVERTSGYFRRRG